MFTNSKELRMMNTPKPRKNTLKNKEKASMARRPP